MKVEHFLLLTIEAKVKDFDDPFAKVNTSGYSRIICKYLSIKTSKNR